MPRVVLLTSSDLNGIGAIGANFSMGLAEDDEFISKENVRRAIMMDQDIDQQCDDLDTYFEGKGYPKISDNARQTLKDMRATAENNSTIVAAWTKWKAEQEAQLAVSEATE